MDENVRNVPYWEKDLHIFVLILDQNAISLPTGQLQDERGQFDLSPALFSCFYLHNSYFSSGR